MRSQLWNSFPGLRQAKICLGNYNQMRSEACIDKNGEGVIGEETRLWYPIGRYRFTYDTRGACLIARSAGRSTTGPWTPFTFKGDYIEK